LGPNPQLPLATLDPCGKALGLRHFSLSIFHIVSDLFPGLPESPSGHEFHAKGRDDPGIGATGRCPAFQVEKTQGTTAILTDRLACRALDVLQGIANQYFTQGILNGFAIVGIAIIFDRINQAYGQRLKKHRGAAHE
jgi:hypothetical protein